MFFVPEVAGLNGRKFELQIKRRTGTIGLLSFSDYPLTRFTMTLATKLEKYHGVQCRSCGETIAVPSRIANKEVALEHREAVSDGGMKFPSLNLRCRVCEKENFYKMSDVLEIEGTPSPSAAREETSPRRLRPQAKLSRAAKA